MTVELIGHQHLQRGVIFNFCVARPTIATNYFNTEYHAINRITFLRLKKRKYRGQKKRNFNMKAILCTGDGGSKRWLGLASQHRAAANRR